MYIITHRGLDPSRDNYFAESSLEAFTDQLTRGFGLEFDIRLTKDKKIIVCHDADLKRISLGSNLSKIEDMTENEICELSFNGCHLISLDKLLDLINEKGGNNCISAIHLKHSCQNGEFLEIFLEYVKDIEYKKFIIFDVSLETAKFLKEKNPNLQLAASVSHKYDIERYNSAVGGTLMDVDTFLKNSVLFNWAWLDEWDLVDKDGSSKKFYRVDLFERIKEYGIKIALVTPELHATSPSLLGGESHNDAKDKETLIRRIKEIVDLRPDAICTDYPDLNNLYV